MKGDETNGATLRQFTVSVVLLDDTSQQFILDKKAKGADLLEMVFQVQNDIITYTLKKAIYFKENYKKKTLNVLMVIWQNLYFL